MDTNLSLNQEIINSLGLDYEKVKQHHKKIHQALKGDLISLVSIEDACSVENKTILSWDATKTLIENTPTYLFLHAKTQVERLNWIKNYVITCIPAAGAASRYWHNVNSNITNIYNQLPKALIPVTVEGDTFLDIKILEQTFLMPTLGNVLIVPSGLREEFEKIISTKSSMQWLILEQIKKLLTIRFRMNGEPYLLDDNIYSPVPAGHGELIYLFEDILKQYPTSCALHLRNIDNIIGIHSEQAQELSFLAESFYVIRAALNTLREKIKYFLDQKDMQSHFTDEVYISALNFLNMYCVDFVPNIPIRSEEDWQIILNNLNKPLSIFGVVKKEPGDQGGGPVLIKTSDGHKIKICLEMSHVNDFDRETYFEENGKSHYFNPVLVFFETQTDQGIKTKFDELFDDNFWLLSKRNYLNENVCYHETVLYELIGNSEKTNLVFIEVPRSLFKPHKYFSDSKDKTRKFYRLTSYK